MRLLFFDAFSGVSGDMTVGALLALGVDLERLRSELATLPLSGYAVRASEKMVHGIQACKFDVDVDTEAGARPHARPCARHRSRPCPSRLRRHPRHDRRQSRCRRARATRHRRSSRASPRPRRACTASRSMPSPFTRSARSTRSSTSSARRSAWRRSTIDAVYVSALPLGSGTVSSQHGVIPVPAPATVELLRGFPVRVGDGTGELVTPTGAAIVAALARPGAALPPMRIEAVGYGAGTPDAAGSARICCASCSGTPRRRRRRRRAGRDRHEHRRQQSGALRARHGTALRRRRARRLARAGADEEEPSRHGAARARRAGRSRRARGASSCARPRRSACAITPCSASSRRAS